MLRKAQLATERREACLREGRSLAFETVFSAADKPEFVRRTLGSWLIGSSRVESASYSKTRRSHRPVDFHSWRRAYSQALQRGSERIRHRPWPATLAWMRTSAT